MPYYVTSPFKAPTKLLVAGRPSYVFGKFDDRTPPTSGPVVSNSAVTTTATLTFLIKEGNIPAVGALVTVIGCANSNNFNVTNVAIATVSTTADGHCTITYTITSTTQGTLADGGQVLIPQVEVGDVLAAGASVPVAAPFNNPEMNQGKVINVFVSFPTQPTTVTVVLQGADTDLDSEYVTIGTVVSAANTPGSFTTGQGTAGTIAAANMVNYRFYRLLNSSLTGTGTIVGKIEV